MAIWLLLCLGLLCVSVLSVASDGEDDIPFREATAKRKHLQIPLDKLDFKSDEYPELYFCHRTDVEEDLDQLVNSLIREGQAESVQVWKKPKTDRYLVVAGHRRVKALRRAAEQQTDPSFRDDMLVDCVVIVTDSKADLLATSLATNAQRKDLSPLEVLAAVKKLRDAGFSDARGAAAIGYAKTQYQRFVDVVENEQLYKHVRDGDIGITKASRIIEAVRKAANQLQTLDDVLRDFGDWCEERRAEIQASKEQYEAAGRKFPENQLKVDFYITSGVFKNWLRRIDNDEPLLGEDAFEYGVLLDEKKAKLTIPGISNLDLRTARSDDLLKIIKAIVGLPRRLVPYVRQAEYQERIRTELPWTSVIDPEFEEFLKDTGLEHRVDELKRQADAEREAEAGEPAPDGERPQRPAGDMSDAIDLEMRRAGAAPPPEQVQDEAVDPEA